MRELPGLSQECNKEQNIKTSSIHETHEQPTQQNLNKISKRLIFFEDKQKEGMSK